MAFQDIVRDAGLVPVDSSDLSVIQERTEKLIKYYRGDQKADLNSLIDTILQKSEIAARYKELAIVRNVIGWISSRVNMLGRSKINVIFPNDEETESWQDWWDNQQFQLFLETAGELAEVLGTVVLQPYWDDGKSKVKVRVLTADVMEIYYEPTQFDKLCPVMYVIEVDEERGIKEVWDLRDGVRDQWMEDGSGNILGEVTKIPEEIGDPFIPIRRGATLNEYWFSNGQETLIDTQEKLNYLLTQSAVQIFYGLQFPIVEGAAPESEDMDARDGKVPVEKPRLDPTEIFFTGVDESTNTARKLQFLGPQVGPVIDSIFGVIDFMIDGLASAYNLPSGSFRVVSSEARSGVSIEIENAPLRDKWARDRLIYNATMKDLVGAILQTWNSHDPATSPDPESDFIFELSDPQFAVVETARRISDAELVSRGLLKASDFVRRERHDMTEEEAVAYLKTAAEQLSILTEGGAQTQNIAGRQANQFRPRITGNRQVRNVTQSSDDTITN